MSNRPLVILWILFALAVCALFCKAVRIKRERERAPALGEREEVKPIDWRTPAATPEEAQRKKAKVTMWLKMGELAEDRAFREWEREYEAELRAEVRRGIRLGMSSTAAMLVWGYPDDINRTRFKDLFGKEHVHEQWCYRKKDAYLFFKNGILTTIMD